MRIAIAGGSGVVGKYVVAAAEAEAHQPVVLSRSWGIDVRSGEGLADALARVDVVIDVLNAGTTRGKDAEAFFVDTSRRLQQAASQAGVRHIVTLSIVGIDKASSYGYYTAKLAQEKAVREGPVPVTIVRATQFHEFAGQMLATLSRGPVALVPKMCSQPVAARSVGEVLVETAQTRPGGTIEVAGPGMVEVPDMARRLLAARGRRMLVVPVTVPGAAGRAMRGDALLANPGTRICGPTYDEWLHSDDAQAVTF